MPIIERISAKQQAQTTTMTSSSYLALHVSRQLVCQASCGRGRDESISDFANLRNSSARFSAAVERASDERQHAAEKRDEKDK
ncbi:hypothetical protein Trydic_g8710 [Trypoxylus dichotomus]